MKLVSNRAGHLKRMQSDYECFVLYSLKELKHPFVEAKDKKRYRQYVYKKYVDILSEGTLL